MHQYSLFFLNFLFSLFHFFSSLLFCSLPQPSPSPPVRSLAKALFSVLHNLSFMARLLSPVPTQNTLGGYRKRCPYLCGIGVATFVQTLKRFFFQHLNFFFSKPVFVISYPFLLFLRLASFWPITITLTLNSLSTSLTILSSFLTATYLL